MGTTLSCPLPDVSETHLTKNPTAQDKQVVVSNGADAVRTDIFKSDQIMMSLNLERGVRNWLVKKKLSFYVNIIEKIGNRTYR